MNIDLHIHSTASDGTFSPAKIVALALKLSLGAISITDHDTVSGAREVISAGIPDSLGFLSGVEISSSPPPPFHCSGSFHILGYGMDTENADLNRLLADLQGVRRDRNPKIIQRLNALGIDISLDEVTKASGGAQISRPHIAAQMIKRSFVRSMDEAFDRYLGSSGAAFVDKFQIDAPSAIKTITDAGGIPVLAHPLLMGNIRKDISATDRNNSRKAGVEELILYLKGMGLEGIEVYYPEHTKETTLKLAALAERHQLFATGGSDFHGAIKEGIRMGSGKGDLSVPFALYTKLKDACPR